MKTVKLSKNDLLLLHLALDITASDYTVDEENPEPYRVKMQLGIQKLKDKLIKSEVGNGK